MAYPGGPSAHPGPSYPQPPYPGWSEQPETGAVGAVGTPVVVPVAERDRLTRWVLRMHARAPRWSAPLAALGCMAAAATYTLISNPTTSAPDAPATCLLKLTTGLDCPGCGGTRAMWYLLHGDLPAAARHHLIWVFVLPFLLYLYLSWAMERGFGVRLPKLRISSRTIGLVLAVWVAFSIARNLPWAPFTALYV
ncbi:DUF2752 domain-containing protein [Plantactinospora sp. KBS50]|uniref:DUF2752 domain-containing protein n=1 Tax=Plantactinospora sp. KBS50 TaxID=2024580 RepID=UPI000BAAF1E0|nr:DUF2752 domain-containing protein [Plantactinospora sp. KBS50]ASW54082.1 hypothetical protein CIK06_07615 [Plantactinospora sp. KBS50]